MKSMKKTISFILMTAMAITVASPLTALADEGVEKGYTYTYDYWGEVQYSPDAYSVVGVYTAGVLGIEGGFKNPDGLFIKDRFVFVCDTGNNRIIQWERTDNDEFRHVRTINEIKGDVNIKNLSGPTDVFMTDDGSLYICDKGNQRILKIDKDLNFLMEYTKPNEATFDQTISFLPDKLIVDSEGRVYAVCDNVNKGIVKYERDGKFSGFFGAMPAKYSWYKYFWKRFIASDAQRRAMENFVPTEYDNIAIDSEGFFYACTINVTGNDSSEEPVRRLNLLGKNILIENGYEDVIGDVQWGTFAGYNGPSLFLDVTALDNKVYVCMDKTRGRLFAYDEQGNLLYAFGGVGNIEGNFRGPVALDHMGNDLFVLDSIENSLTVFAPTEYGNLIFKALDEYDRGDYIASGETWEKVRELNGNCDLAYIGIGRSLLRQKKYGESLTYFKTKWDTDHYSKAFKRYRKEWVEKYIGWIFLAFFAVLITPLAIKRVKQIKHEIDTADIFKPGKDQEIK
jgi:hypothetical protein